VSGASVRLAGSRARGEETQLSDWDFQVETDDFTALAEALPRLVEPMRPLSRQWDRYSPHPTYMLKLRARDDAERRFGLRLDRALGDEVARGLRRAGYDLTARR
jgi:predicted nucleotidyltransferase